MKENITEEKEQNSRNFNEIAAALGQLVTEKNKAYGNSFFDSITFLKILYPNGVSPDQYGDVLFIIRIFDKLKRIATNKGAFEENPYQDIAGYGLLGIKNYEDTKRETNRTDR